MLVVWGPLMVGGTYYAATGSIPGAVVLASLPYALLCTTVLMGKHIDKIPWDEPDGTHTLPVILGEARARARHQGMFVLFYVSIVALVIAQVLPVASVLVVRCRCPIMVRAWKAYSRTEARGVADTEPGLAVVVRSALVPRHPPGRWPVRAGTDRRRNPRLVNRPRSGFLDFGLAALGAFCFGCTILFSRAVARDGVPPSVALGIRFGCAGLLLLAALAIMRRPLLPPVGERFAALALGLVPLRGRVDVLLHGPRARHRRRGRAHLLRVPGGHRAGRGLARRDAAATADDRRARCWRCRASAVVAVGGGEVAITPAGVLCVSDRSLMFSTYVLVSDRVLRAHRLADGRDVDRARRGDRGAPFGAIRARQLEVPSGRRWRRWSRTVSRPRPRSRSSSSCSGASARRGPRSCMALEAVIGIVLSRDLPRRVGEAHRRDRWCGDPRGRGARRPRDAPADRARKRPLSRP